MGVKQVTAHLDVYPHADLLWCQVRDILPLWRIFRVIDR
jgi:hypothetical protein